MLTGGDGATTFVPGTDTKGLGPDKPEGGLAHEGWYDGFMFSQALTIGGGTGDGAAQHRRRTGARAAPRRRCRQGPQLVGSPACVRPRVVNVDLIEAAEGVHELVEAHADKAEQGRRLPKRLVQALRDAQLFRMCVPTVYGGPEADPVTLVRAIETVATADGAAGWCTMIASTTSSMSLFMEPDFAKQVFADPKSIAGGAYAPNGRAVADGDGWRVTGRWQWGSGTQHCNWISGGVNTEDGEFHLMFMDAADVSIHDTWYSSGLRGSGSNDFSVDGAFVPRGRTVQPLVGHRQVRCPLAAFPNFSLLAAGVAAVSLGVARHAIDEFTELAQGKRPLFSARTVSQSGSAQAELARAEARLRAAQRVPARRAGKRVGGCAIGRPGRHLDTRPHPARQRSRVRGSGPRHRRRLHVGRRYIRVRVESVATMPARRPRRHAAHAGVTAPVRDAGQDVLRPGNRHVDVLISSHDVRSGGRGGRPRLLPEARRAQRIPRQLVVVAQRPQRHAMQVVAVGDVGPSMHRARSRYRTVRATVQVVATPAVSAPFRVST